MVLSLALEDSELLALRDRKETGMFVGKGKWLAAGMLIVVMALSSCGISAGSPAGSEIGKGGSPEAPEPEKTREELQAERDQLELERREELGVFYVPLPSLDQDPEPKTVTAKALYMTANVAGMNFSEEDIAYYADYVRAVSGQSGKAADESRMADINKLEKILGICESTEINALVIDIKNDHGLVAWESDIPYVDEIGSNWTTVIKDPEKLMAYLKDKGIYTIARIVAFKDPYYPSVRGEHAIQLKAGGVYLDKRGVAWVNPFDETVWKYVVAVSKEAALRGFDEIQYDYVRFPEGAAYYNPITEFPGREGRDKDQGIEDFLKFARKELEPYPVHLSADVFGVITRSWDDKPDDIGQTWRLIANQVEYICPMIYPSHYGPNLYGFTVPDQHPYEVVRYALLEAIERNAAQQNPGIIRPWYQAFTASWVRGYIPYDAKAISDQIIAGAELGIEEYILWNASNQYDPMSLFYQDRVKKTIREPGKDLVGRTPKDALTLYLEGEKRNKTSQVYLLTPMEDRPAEFDDFLKEWEALGLNLSSYEILGITEGTEGAWKARVRVTTTSTQGDAESKEVHYDILPEKGVFKIRRP